MKIVQVISSLANGGAEKFIVELSNELSLSNQVLLISIKDIEDWMYPPQYLSKRVNLLTLGKKKGFDLNVLSELYKLLRSQEPNVVHIHLNMSMYYFLPLIPLFQKIKFFLLSIIPLALIKSYWRTLVDYLFIVVSRTYVLLKVYINCLMKNSRNFTFIK